jgi:allantoin racemase
MVLNPNTSHGMTASIGRAAQAVAGPTTEILAVQPEFGPVSIEGFYDEAIAAAGVAARVRASDAQDIQGLALACFGDPGLEAAREALACPVLGIAEAAFHAAAMVSSGFSIVTTMTRTCVIAEHLVVKYGFERQCRGIHGTDVPVLALEDAGDALQEQLFAASQEALNKDGSDAIVLGCAGMAPLCEALQQRLGVPVIDGVAAAVKLLEALHGLGLKTSKRCNYARPLEKTYLGWAAPLGWPPKT